MPAETRTLDDFARPDSQQEHSVPLGPDPIRNFALVRELVAQAFDKNPERTTLLLTSNGSEDRPATEYRLRRVIH